MLTLANPCCHLRLIDLGRLIVQLRGPLVVLLPDLVLLRDLCLRGVVRRERVQDGNPLVDDLMVVLVHDCEKGSFDCMPHK